ncbi:hypothetical protein FQZ97_549070 [compost metagenome]
MQVHAVEGRDVHLLVAVLLDDGRAVVVRDRNQVAVPLPEGVVDLVQQRLQRAAGCMAEPDAERVEHMAEQPRHGQQPDRAAGRKAGLAQPRLHLGPQVAARAVAMVGGMKAEQVEPVHREAAQPGVQLRQFVDVDQQVVDPVAQPMPLRPQPLVHDAPDVECRASVRIHDATVCAPCGRWMRPDSCATRQGRRTPPSASATARPACNPSSWKPAPK